jgi:hypothetical protein
MDLRGEDKLWIPSERFSFEVKTFTWFFFSTLTSLSFGNTFFGGQNFYLGYVLANAFSKIWFCTISTCNHVFYSAKPSFAESVCQI